MEDMSQKSEQDAAEQQQQQPAEEVSQGSQSDQNVIAGQQPQPETAEQPLTSVDDEQTVGVQNEVMQPEVATEEANSISADTTTTAVDTTESTTPLRVASFELTAADKLNELNDDVAMMSAAAASLVASSTGGGGGAVVGSKTNGVHRLTAHEVDMAELKVKIICQEKNNMALKMELKCAELQVAAKEKLDTKKTRLIELLDAKVSAVEKKNLRLIEMMEQMVRDKDSHSHRLIDATKKMEDLGKRLVDSERGRGEMRRINTELKTMLDNVEGKGTQIAKLAKEKVLKYKGENERIQRELDDLKGGGCSGSGSPASGSGSATPLPVPGCCEDSLENQAAAGEDGSTTAAGVFGYAEAIAKTEDLSRQLEAAMLGKDWSQQESSMDELRAVLVDASRIAGELRPAFEQLLQRVGHRDVVSAAARVSAEDVAVKLRRDRAVVAEEVEAKDREIVALKDELARLKGAIGQLVGLNIGLPPPATAAVAPSRE